MAKQRTIETILYQNNELLKLDQYYNKNIEQEITVSKAEEKVQKLNKISQESKKQIIGVVKKMRIKLFHIILKISDREKYEKGFYCW